MNLCRFNISQCLNGGSCAVDVLLNTTYCLCDECHEGLFCETLRRRQSTYDTYYIFFILSIFAGAISIFNNSVCLELFIRCKSIRSTNTGVYLIIYSILSILASGFLLVDSFIAYHLDTFKEGSWEREAIRCVFGVVGYNVAAYLCIWISASIQLERGLLLYEGATRSSTRLKPGVLSGALVGMSVVCGIPFLYYTCDWENTPNLKIYRIVLMYFHIGIPIIIYLVATGYSLKGFANRIRAFGLEKCSYKKTYFKLLCSHLFIFVPPIMYLACYVPFNILASFRKPGSSYYFCGISLTYYVVRVFLRALTGFPFISTWFLFVYPSKVYMTEFYMNTWCGQWTAWLVLRLRRRFSRQTPLRGDIHRAVRIRSSKTLGLCRCLSIFNNKSFRSSLPLDDQLPLNEAQ